MNKLPFDELLDSIIQGELLTGVVSSPWRKREDGLLRVSLRPLTIKNQNLYQICSHYSQKVTHKNLTAEHCAALISDYLPNQFAQGMFGTKGISFHVLVNKQRKMTVVKKKVSEAGVAIVHNRQKKYILQEGVPIPFLISLGIMGADGRVIAKKYDKFRQINRFVEIVSDVIDHLPKDRTIEVIDFGCGKAYLTFALYHYLHVIEGRSVKISGLDLKKDVIEKCQALADALGYSDLKFAVGDINHHQPEGKVDLVISLHACDTATDAALEKGIRWGAEVILCVPCCQHELYEQVKNESFSTLLRHGILRERFAALATDAARAELLTALGYETQILEFIEMEHTPKNLLLRSIKHTSKQKQIHALKRYHLFKELLHIEPSLERRFKMELNT